MSENATATKANGLPMWATIPVGIMGIILGILNIVSAFNSTWTGFFELIQLNPRVIAVLLPILSYLLFGVVLIIFGIIGIVTGAKKSEKGTGIAFTILSLFCMGVAVTNLCAGLFVMILNEGTINPFDGKAIALMIIMFVAGIAAIVASNRAPYYHWVALGTAIIAIVGCIMLFSGANGATIFFLVLGILVALLDAAGALVAQLVRH